MNVTITCTNSGQSGTSTPLDLANKTPINASALLIALQCTSTADDEILNVTLRLLKTILLFAVALAPGADLCLNEYSNYSGFCQRSNRGFPVQTV